MADGDHFSSAGDWKNMKPKYIPKESKIKIRKPRVPKFRSQSDIKKIAQLREDMLLTATAHDKTIDDLAELRNREKLLFKEIENLADKMITAEIAKTWISNIGQPMCHGDLKLWKQIGLKLKSTLPS